MGNEGEKAGGHLSARDLRSTSALQLSDGMVLTGATVVGEVYRGTTAVRGYFTDSLFRDCTFTECSFRRCDFEAVTFENCTFDGCDFGSSDLRSTDFVGCTVLRGNFPNGSTKGCRYVETRLSECRFYRQSFESNSLENCLIDRCKFHRSTVLHIDFAKCRFVGTSLSDCTSLYHVFDDCEFSASSINVDSIALSWGLTRENLESLKLVWQGRRQRKAPEVDQLLQELIDTLLGHGWGIPACVLALNFSMTPRLAALDAALAAIWSNIVVGRPVRIDELQFLTKVIDRLSRTGELPFLAVVHGLDLCARIAENHPEREESFRAFGYALQDAEFRSIIAWEETWDALQGPPDTLLEVEFIFDEPPATSLVAMLQELHDANQIGGRSPELISSRHGSYIEVVCITLGTLMALNIALGMLIQTVGHLITLRHRVGALTAPETKSLARKRALEPTKAPSAELGKQVAMMLGLLAGGAIPIVISGAEAIASQLRNIKLPSDFSLLTKK